jgi:hypothetical protein
MENNFVPLVKRNIISMEVEDAVYEEIRAYGVYRIGESDVYLLTIHREGLDDEVDDEHGEVRRCYYFSSSEAAASYANGMIIAEKAKVRNSLLREGYCPNLTCRLNSAPTWAYCPACGEPLRSAAELIFGNKQKNMAG